MEQLKKKVRIVPMTNEYLNDVAELERTCFSNPWSRNMLAEELENACSAFLVALDAENGSVVGYAGLLAVVDEGCITKMAVRPDCRRGGVAGPLLAVFIRFAAGSGLAGIPASLAALRLILEASLCIEFLLSSGEHELVAALFAY